GLLGQKSGRGFYLHGGKKVKINPLVQDLLHIEGVSGASLALPAAARLSEGRERMVLLMVNEAALGVSEGLTAAASIDLAMVLGTGWAPHRGGPLRYADDRGLGDIVQSLTSLAARHGRRFEPCAELRRRAEANEPFTRPMPALV